MSVSLDVGGQVERDELLKQLVLLLYERNDIAPRRGQFRVSGDTVDVYPAYRDDVVRIELWGDEVERLTARDPLTQTVTHTLQAVRIFPAKHFMMPENRLKYAEGAILEEMRSQVRMFEESGRFVEAQRVYQRTQYDLEMMRELGYCNGIENYSSHLSTRELGSRPYTLLDYFPDDFITIIDESHVTIPQLRAMYNADRSRKETLVNHGFRLPSALDNRPLQFDEFCNVINQTVCVSATPAAFEIEHSVPVEQVARPTGLLDPIVEMRPLANQVDDLMAEVQECAAKGQRVLVTTLTKRTSEALSDYLNELDLRAKYMHSEIDALERVEILRDLRRGDFDCLIGVNLLREGLDLPEVALVAVLDADKEGFLRSETALVQTAGRASRNKDGRVILYADTITNSMKRMMDVTELRRERQLIFNEKNGITPRSVVRPIQSSLKLYDQTQEPEKPALMAAEGDLDDLKQVIGAIENEMREASQKLEFERAAMLRDQVRSLKKQLDSESTDTIRY